MTSKEIRIGLSSGLEARPAAMLVQVASQYESSIYVESEEKRVNAKSIMGMMTLGLAEGAHVKVTADGSDEESAIEGIEKYEWEEKGGIYTSARAYRVQSARRIE